MIRRREFFALAAALPASALRGVETGKIPARKAGKVETVFKSPGPKPNGLQATSDGLWIIDQGDNRAYLVSYTDGKVLRAFDTEGDRASGITFYGDAIWIASTYSREIVQSQAMTGKTIAKHFTPGAGVIYRMVGDPPSRSSPLASASAAAQQPRESQQQGQGLGSGQGSGQGQGVGGFQQGQVLGSKALGTGAHGLEWREGKLWVAVPPSRTIYRINPKDWIVELKFPTVGNRPHGIGWEGKWLWCADSNLNAFFKHDPETGEVVEKIQLADKDPLPHGMTIWQGMMWYCDDVGVVCRLKM
jgi:hypothetical protein